MTSSRVKRTGLICLRRQPGGSSASLNPTPGQGAQAVWKVQRPEGGDDDMGTITTWTCGNEEIPHSSFCALSAQLGIDNMGMGIHPKCDVLLSSG